MKKVLFSILIALICVVFVSFFLLENEDTSKIAFADDSLVDILKNDSNTSNWKEDFNNVVDFSVLEIKSLVISDTILDGYTNEWTVDDSVVTKKLPNTDIYICHKTSDIYSILLVSNKTICAPDDSTGLFSFVDSDGRLTSKLEYIDVSKLDTSNVVCMDEMFYGLINLKELDLSDLNMERVTTCTNMLSTVTPNIIYAPQNISNILSINLDCKYYTSTKYDNKVVGWDKKISYRSSSKVVSGSKIISTLQKGIAITFKDVYKSEFDKDFTQLVPFGDTPNYGTDPIKLPSQMYEYSFSNWTPQLKPATYETEYTAQYNSTIRNYTITWMNGNEKLYEAVYQYGDFPIYQGEIPTKESEINCEYEFAGWDHSLSIVKGDFVYGAVFNKIDNEEKNNLPWWGYLIVSVVVLFIIVFSIIAIIYKKSEKKKNKIADASKLSNSINDDSIDSIQTPQDLVDGKETINNIDNSNCSSDLDLNIQDVFNNAELDEKEIATIINDINDSIEDDFQESYTKTKLDEYFDSLENMNNSEIADSDNIISDDTINSEDNPNKENDQVETLDEESINSDQSQESEQSINNIENSQTEIESKPSRFMQLPELVCSVLNTYKTISKKTLIKYAVVLMSIYTNYKDVEDRKYIRQSILEIINRLRNVIAK